MKRSCTDTDSDNSQEGIHLKSGCKIPKRLLDAPAETFNLCQANALHTLLYLESSAIESRVSLLANQRTADEKERLRQLTAERERESAAIQTRAGAVAASLIEEKTRELISEHEIKLRNVKIDADQSIYSKECERLEFARKNQVLADELEFIRRRKEELDSKLFEICSESSRIEAEIRLRAESEASVRFEKEISAINAQMQYERAERNREREARVLKDEAHLMELKSLTEKRLIEKHNSSKKGAATELEVLDLLIAAFPQFEVELCSRSPYSADITLKNSSLKVLVEVKAHECVVSSSDPRLRGIETSEVDKMKRDMLLDLTQDIGVLISTKTYFCNQRQQATVDIQLLEDGRALYFIHRLAERDDPVKWIADTLSLPFQLAEHGKKKKLATQSESADTAAALELLDRQAFKSLLIQDAEKALAAQIRDNRSDAERRKRLVKELEETLEARKNMKC